MKFQQAIYEIYTYMYNLIAVILYFPKVQNGQIMKYSPIIEQKNRIKSKSNQNMICFIVIIGVFIFESIIINNYQE